MVDPCWQAILIRSRFGRRAKHVHIPYTTILIYTDFPNGTVFGRGAWWRVTGHAVSDQGTHSIQLYSGNSGKFSYIMYTSAYYVARWIERKAYYDQLKRSNSLDLGNWLGRKVQTNLTLGTIWSNQFVNGKLVIDSDWDSTVECYIWVLKHSIFVTSSVQTWSLEPRTHCSHVSTS